MRKLQFLAFSFLTLLSASAFACGPAFDDSLPDRLVLSGLLAIFHVIAYGTISLLYLAIVSRSQSIGLKRGAKYWFGSVVLTYVVGTVGTLGAIYVENWVGDTHATVFAITLPLVALAGYFARIASNSQERFLEMNT